VLGKAYVKRTDQREKALERFEKRKKHPLHKEDEPWKKTTKKTLVLIIRMVYSGNWSAPLSLACLGGLQIACMKLVKVSLEWRKYTLQGMSRQEWFYAGLVQYITAARWSPWFRNGEPP
jgi:hypothetical protein